MLFCYPACVAGTVVPFSAFLHTHAKRGSVEKMLKMYKQVLKYEKDGKYRQGRTICFEWLIRGGRKEDRIDLTQSTQQHGYWRMADAALMVSFFVK